MRLTETPIFEELPRGCGWRKPGGIYLRGDPPEEGCGKLPFEVKVCPCCGEGIRPSRAPRWFQPQKFLLGMRCESAERRMCKMDPLGDPCPFEDGQLPSLPERSLLLWIGAKFYSSTAGFLREARMMGYSRRITVVPRGFKLGETWIFLAHRQTPFLRDAVSGEMSTLEPELLPGVFAAFRPERIEYVCRGDETEEELDRLVDRGFTPVRVQRIELEDDIDDGSDVPSCCPIN